MACAGIRPPPEPAGGGIAGTVVDAVSDKPLRSVLVRVRGADGIFRGALTDEGGEFVFGPLTSGKHDFTVEHAGYRTASGIGVAVEPGRDTTMNIRLMPAEPADSLRDAKIVPPVLVTRSDPCYSADALNAGVEGWMVVRCTLTTEGRVTRCAIIRDLPYMGANVIQALEQRRYAPAMRNGEPIEVNYTFKLHLTMP